MEQMTLVFCQIDVQEFHLWAHRGNIERETCSLLSLQQTFIPSAQPSRGRRERVLKKGKSEEKRYQIFTFIYSTHICTFFLYKE
jgi:hypothetical protein